MNPNTVSNVLQIITAAMNLSPLAIATISGVKNLLAADPSVPTELQKILSDTANDNAATLAAIQQWRDAHPGQ